MKAKPNEAERRMADVLRALKSLENEASTPEGLADVCQAMAAKLTSAAAHWRRIAKQQKKGGAAGAVHDTRK